MPPRRRSAWKPASPLRAMIRPSGTDPLGDQSFSTTPTRLFGMYRIPESTTAATTAPSNPTAGKTSQSPGKAWAQDDRPVPEPQCQANAAHVATPFFLTRCGCRGGNPLATASP